MDNETIYGRIKILRNALGLSQAEFGQRLGVGRSVIANIEVGRVGARTVLVHHMCEIFSVNPEWVYTGRGEMHMDNDEIILEPVCEKYGLSPAEKRALLTYIRLPKSDRQCVGRVLMGIADSVRLPEE